MAGIPPADARDHGRSAAQSKENVQRGGVVEPVIELPPGASPAARRLDERGTRGVLVNGWTGKAEKVVRADGWNDLEIYCKGEQMRITLNGLVTAELKDSAKLEGIIALQLHKGPPMEVRFRNLRIKELK